MAKDPAFLFYPGDWLGGTMGMTIEQKGAYFELLMMQFNNYQFTESQAKQVLSVCFDYAWPTIKHKFESDGAFYWNARLREEIEKRKKYVESRRYSGLTPKKKKAYAKRTHKRTENENENEIKDVIEVYNKTTFSKIEKLTDVRKSHLSARIKEYGFDIVCEVINKADQSDFLHGKNNNGWKANFDWIFNPQNFIKILEGNYENKAAAKETVSYGASEPIDWDNLK